jgi:hypothetical protein
MRVSAAVYAIVSALLLLPSSHGFNTIPGLLHPVAVEQRRKLRPRPPAVDLIPPRPLKLDVGPSLTDITHARNLLRQLERQWHSDTEVTPFEAPSPAEGQPEICTMDWIPPAMGQLDISEVITGRAIMSRTAWHMHPLRISSGCCQCCYDSKWYCYWYSVY